jgi:hypothetical protein
VLQQVEKSLQKETMKVLCLDEYPQQDQSTRGNQNRNAHTSSETRNLKNQHKDHAREGHFFCDQKMNIILIISTAINKTFDIVAYKFIG